MSFSLKPFLKRAGKIALALFLAAFILQVGISVILSISKERIVKQAAQITGYRIALGRASFSFLRGLNLKRLAVFYEGRQEPPIFVNNAFVSVRIFPLLFGKIALHADISSVVLLMKKETEGYNVQIILSDIPKRLNLPDYPHFKLPINTVTARIKSAKIIYADDPNLRQNLEILHKNIRIIFYKSGKLVFNSSIKFRYIIPEETNLSKLLASGTVEQGLKCSLQGTFINEKDLNIDMLLLSLSDDQIIGTGLIKDFTERNPHLNIDFVHSMIFLKNIAFLRNNFKAEGTSFISLKLIGPFDDIKTEMSAQLNECAFSYKPSEKEILDFKNVNGKFEFKDKEAKFDVSLLNPGGLPLNIKLKTALGDDPDIYLTVYLSRDFFSRRNIPLDKLEIDFEGKVKDIVRGRLKARALYVKKGLKFDLGADFKNIEFNYRAPPGEKYFLAKEIELFKKDAFLSQKLIINNLNSRVITVKENLAAEDIVLSAYNGIVGGRLNFNLKDKPHLTASLSGRGLDINKIMQDTNITNKLLSGKLDIKISFDSHSAALLNGRCFVKEGVADLDALAATVDLPSLKNTAFDIMGTYFMFTKDLIKVRGIKLYSRDIMLNAFWDIDDKIKGAVNLKIASLLLKQSPSFRKLLSLADFKKPYVDFKFRVGGISRAARLMWIKGEFKEKLEAGLAQWVKRSIQANLNEAIEGVAAKN